MHQTARCRRAASAPLVMRGLGRQSYCKMPLTDRFGTCVHEAGHAVVCHVLGLLGIHVTIYSDSHGEFMPECGLCRRCLTHLERHNPDNDEHAAEIRDDLLKSVAVAVAGEVAEQGLCPGLQVSESELAVDRYLAFGRASAALLHQDTACYLRGGADGPGQCARCDRLVSRAQVLVNEIVRHHEVASAIVGLAKRLDAESQLLWPDVRRFLQELNIEAGSWAARITALRH